MLAAKLFGLVLLNPSLVSNALAAGLTAGFSGLAGLCQLVGYVGAGAALISAGLSASGERGIGGLKMALVSAGVSAAGFTAAGYLFNAFGSPVQVNPTNPN